MRTAKRGATDKSRGTTRGSWCSDVKALEGDAGDTHRLAGMASSLNFAARKLLCLTGDLETGDGLSVANAEADRAHLETDIQLADDAKEQHP